MRVRVLIPVFRNVQTVESVAIGQYGEQETKAVPDPEKATLM